jgi:hypothetical protein
MLRVLLLMKEQIKLLLVVPAFIAVNYIPWACETIRQSGPARNMKQLDNGGKA